VNFKIDFDVIGGSATFGKIMSKGQRSRSWPDDIWLVLWVTGKLPVSYMLTGNLLNGKLLSHEYYR